MRPRGNPHGPRGNPYGPRGNPHVPRGRPQWYERSYTNPQEAKEDIAPQAPPPLLPGVWYSLFPIIKPSLFASTMSVSFRLRSPQKTESHWLFYLKSPNIIWCTMNLHHHQPTYDGLLLYKGKLPHFVDILFLFKGQHDWLTDWLKGNCSVSC